MTPQTLLLLFVLAAAFNLVLTPLFIRLARLHGILDTPGHRKIHATPVGKLGGAALLVSAVGSGVLVHLFYPRPEGQVPFPSAPALWVLGTTLALALLGFLDDLYDLKPRNKLLLQSALLGAFAIWGYRFETMHLPGFAPFDLGALAIPLTLLWLLAVVNGFNFMDGSDGLAASVTAVILTALLVLGSFLPGLEGRLGLAAAFLGALLVFLAFNWRPARIYLGDAGSNALGTFLGACLVTLPVHGASSGTTEVLRFHFLVACLLAGYPLLEMGLSTLRRLTKRLRFGRSMEWSEQEHLHHRLMKAGSSAAAICALAAFLQAVLAAAGLLAMADQNALATFLLIPLLMAAAYGVPRLGLLDFLGPGSGTQSPHFKIAVHYSALQKIKLTLANNREEILALVIQTCRELGVGRFRFTVKPDAKGFGGMDYQCKDTLNPHERPDEPNLTEGSAQKDEFFDFYEEPGHRGEALWIFSSHAGEDELDVEYRVLMNDFMRASLEACIRMGDGKEHLALGSIVRLPHHRTSGHALRRKKEKDA